MSVWTKRLIVCVAFLVSFWGTPMLAQQVVRIFGTTSTGTILAALVDTSGRLLVSVAGGAITPTSVTVDPSTCAAPGLGETGATTTGIAFTATPSILNCISGTARSTLTASSLALLVPVLGPNGTAGAPTFSFSGAATQGIYNAGGGSTGFATGGSYQADIGGGQFAFRSDYVLGFHATTAMASAVDAFFTRDGAASLQLGSNAAGVTNQMLKGPDRITSDGVGGNLTIAGGRNRGASAGGSIIFQTSPAAGAGVTGTLATALTIDSTKQATFVGTVASPTFQATGTGTSVANVGANSCGTSAATIAGNQVSGVITVGATAGTQCRVTFTTAAPVARDCTVTDSTTTIATRATYVDTTHTDFLGAFVAGDLVTFICVVR